MTVSDRKCAAAIKQYFSGLGRRTLRSKLKSDEIWKIFWSDFEILRAKYDHVGEQSYGEILCHFSKSGNKYHMKRAWEKMLNDDISPTLYLYGFLLRCSAISGDVIEANSVLKEIRQKGFKLNPGIYFIIMNVFSRRGDYTNCRNTLELMIREFKIQPSEKHLGTLIRASRSYKKSLELQNEFLQYGIKATNESTFTALLFVIMVDNETTDKDAEKVFNDALRDRRVTMNQDIWAAYVGSLIRYPDKMIAASEKMQQYGLTPDFRIYTYLLDTCLLNVKEAGDKYMRLAEAVFEATLSRGIAETPIATQMIKLYSKFDMLDKIEDIRRTHRHTFSQNRETPLMVEAICDAYKKAGRSEEEIDKMFDESTRPYTLRGNYLFYGKDKRQEYLNSSLKSGRSVLRRTRDLTSGFDIRPRKPGGSFNK
eukprot:TRINITY_DN30669_c0_g1_i1.p1 TRINITY_DN30669_c0_g1~~TRINITY_DN30669_c0_g1_i1.p1  ORF type:complete len:424 (+),score=44.99 TRINITY_DN30669_c0_g1_i1:57-1328(+)